MASSPERTLFFRPTLGPGGADRVTATLLRHLDRSRVEPSLALVRREGPLLSEVPDGVVVHALAAPGLRNAIRPLAELLRSAPPDVLFSTSSGANPIAVLAASRAGFGGRVVLSERNGLVRDQGAIRRWVELALKAWTYRRSTLVTAVSEGVRADLVRRLRLDTDSVRTVYNPVVTPELLADADRAGSVPQRTEEPLVLAAGRLEPAKGFLELLDAVALMRRSTPLRLVILGEGSQRGALETRRAALGLDDSVELPGFDSHPARWFRACDVFVLSSRFEGLPGVLIQAMACGTAVVATDCPFGPAEIVEPGATGMLVPVGNSEAMAEAVLTLLRDADLRAGLAEAGRRSVDRFRVDRILPRYEAAILGEPDPA